MEYVENQRLDIRDVKDVSSLLAYFRSHLNWNLGLESFKDVEDYLYEFTADDLGLTEEGFAKIKSLRQLPSLEDEQPWGIFCVEFATEKFSITALRKILSCLVPKVRNASRHAVWNEDDLLFLCFWGTGDNRTICIAHFEQKEDGLSIVRTRHCSPAIEDQINLGKFTERLSRLEWPTAPCDSKAWHDSWTAAFTTAYGEVIKTSKALAERMAEVAVEMRDTIIEAMEVETANGFAHLLFEKVKQTLVHDLTVKDFASMYAQTIVYGLFSARCLDKTPEDFSVEEAISLIPSTNPFLKGLMKDCLGVRRGGLSFDELGVGDVVEMFAHVDAAVIAEDFGRRTGGGREDPVIYFYEDFLKAYDKEQKVKCGEFYTPEPVVGFMVRAVDHILKTRFDLPDGLATDATKKVKYIPEGKKTPKEKDAPAIQMLDPATGTGTFIREIILNIFNTFKKNYLRSDGAHAVAGRARSPSAPPDPAFSEAWSRYVDRNVLPRLNAFELMMAPYAIAHMKLAMVLRDTGYDFKGDKRLQVYLTNSLEEPGNSNKQMMLFDDDPLAAESVAANAVKKNTGINIVIGNPPYSVSSNNKGEWITKLIADYKKDLNEKKLNLDDDYIKFIRLGQYIVERSGIGILTYISNNSFLDGITHRQMRKMLMDVFDEIYIVNLHGDARKHEKCPDGSKDENVFDIQQGVSINLFVKRGNVSRRDAEAQSGRARIPAAPQCTIYYADLYGLCEAKYTALERSLLADIEWQRPAPTSPNFFFVPKDFSGEREYNGFFKTDDLLSLNGSGIQTDRDSLFIDIDKDKLIERAKELFSPPLKMNFVKTYRVEDSSSYNLTSRLEGKKYCQEFIRDIIYRPFDSQWIYYDPSVVSRAAYGVMQHFNNENLALCFKRGFDDSEAVTGFCISTLISRRGWSRPGSNGAEYVFPLYLYQEYHGKMQKVPNLNPEIVKKIEESLRASASPREIKITPEDIFNYIYAVLHSPTYREKYKEFLKIDFPRIPYPTDAKTFHALAALGGQLVAIHTMKDFDEAEDVDFVEVGGAEVVKVKWNDGAVYINGESYFTGVERETFDQYIGGYQPLQKWLKDRKGRSLSADDISHYRRIVRALRRTAALMSEIDKLPVVGK